MDRITFDFETDEVITETDNEKSNLVIIGLKERKKAILEAAAFDTLPAGELADAIDDLLTTLGFDNVKVAR